MLKQGDYTDFGIPATILAHYLRENGIVPEKCDLNSILFLLTPAGKQRRSWCSWWRCWGSLNSILKTTHRSRMVLPTIYQKYPVRYRDYTIRQLCQEMHDLYVSFDVKDLQKAMFRQESLPAVVMNPQDANQAYIRGNVELVRIRDAEGRIAAEGALPYPPGVLCVVPGKSGVGGTALLPGAGGGH